MFCEKVALLSKGAKGPVDLCSARTEVERRMVDSRKVKVDFSLEDMDLSEFKGKATYEQIKAYVLEQTGLKVSSLYIAQIKKKCGLDVGENFNLAKSENARQPKCTPEKEEATIRSLKNGDANEARKLLIEHNLRLVVYIAKKFDNTGVGVEDLISIGTIGLIKAINTFNPEKKIKLATYASRCIENEILMYLRRNNKTKMEVSIDEPLNVDWDGNELLLSDILGTDEDTIYRDMEQEAEKKVLFGAINRLSAREQTIIRMRFGLNDAKGEEKTQKEVADILGISQSYISRLEKKIMQRLKKEMLKYS